MERPVEAPESQPFGSRPRLPPTPTPSPSSTATATSSPRLRDAARSRAAILDAAERVLVRDGWSNATLARIGAEAGVSRGTPAYFFHSKAGLRNAMEARLVADSEAALAEGPGDHVDRATALVVRQLELVAQRPALSRLALEQWTDASASPGGPLTRLERLVIQRLTDLLDAAPGQPGLDCRALAAYLVTVAWAAGLPHAPAGSVLSGSAQQTDYRALVSLMLRKLFDDKDKPAEERNAEGAVEAGVVPDLPPSKQRPWRLPGVS